MAPDDSDEATRESDVTSRPDGADAEANRHPSGDDRAETAQEVADEAAGDEATADEASGRDASDDADPSDDSGSGGELPPVLDVRDSLDRIEREADADVSDELARARTLLDEYEGRGDEAAESRSSLVDDLDGVVVSMRERLSGDADRDAEAIANRLQTYRDARNDASEAVSVSSPHLRDGDERLDAVARREGETATLDATLVNRSDERDGLVRLTFYDADHDPVRRVLSRESDLSADEHRDVREAVAIPEGAEYYDVTALDAADAATPEA